MSYRTPASPRPATVYFDRGGAQRPANGTDRFLHRVFCQVVNGEPISLAHPCAGSEAGFTHLCVCGLMWSGEP